MCMYIGRERPFVGAVVVKSISLTSECVCVYRYTETNPVNGSYVIIE